MSLSCDCSVDVDEPARCYSERLVKARRVHACCECGDPIRVGERHEIASGIGYGGDPFRYRTCLPCARIREHYCSTGWIWGGLADQIKECIGWDYRTVPDGDGGRFDGDVAVRTVDR